MTIIDNAPASPGVYLMKDREGRVIYVGKANNLKNRLRAYSRGIDSRFMVPFLVSRVHDIECILTESEKEALILENVLIKEHRPRYNVIFRDDKTYFTIRIDLTSSFPRFQLVRRPKKDGARYFGPYPSSASARETLRFLQSVFPLRTCGDQELKYRKRPCLEYEIRRCCAPCVARIDAPAYQQLVKDSVAFMEGRGEKLIADLRERMNHASEMLCFEEAAFLRDRITAIEETLEKQRVVSMFLRDLDVFGIYREGVMTQVCVVYVRKGNIIGKKAIPILKIQSESSEIISSLVKQYYDDAAYIPGEVIIPVAIEDRVAIKEWLSEKKGRVVSVIVPKKGERLELLRIAGSNAENIFRAERQLADMEGTHVEMERVLHLTRTPSRMECFDISNIGGAHAVGSMVTFVDGKPWKAGYRRFRIRTVRGADDYAMMYEILYRRFRGKDDLPDLIIVDGGKGQLQVVVTVLKDLHVRGVDVISLAKGAKKQTFHGGQDHVYRIGKKNPVYLSRWPEVLFLLQRIRDEAHRFAVAYHRKVKHKNDFLSELDGIPGIGVFRKKALLEFFGDIKKIREAPAEELRKVRGIGNTWAEKIHAFFINRTGVEHR
ncbi:MAG: excinuclease ABC subunit UvrC [Syntrophaceae bacterium]|nr:excinuclease ABC subunit UvrC [Syntrophaceae bacterium]